MTNSNGRSVISLDLFFKDNCSLSAVTWNFYSSHLPSNFNFMLLQYLIFFTIQVYELLITPTLHSNFT